MLRKIGDAIRRFMYGRYGTDQLNIAIIVVSLIILFVGRFLWSPLMGLALILVGWSVFRSYSRNLAARRKENAWFLRYWNPITDRKNRYFTCPKCRQTVRVPKGKGTIVIHCPKCGESFKKKS